MASDRQIKANDSFTSDIIGDRQKRLLSILLSISSFVIYNGKPNQVERDLEVMTVPKDLCAPLDRQLSLLWLTRDADKESETISPNTFVTNLFSQGSKNTSVDATQRRQNKNFDARIQKLKETFQKQYGYSLVWPTSVDQPKTPTGDTIFRRAATMPKAGSAEQPSDDFIE